MREAVKIAQYTANGIIRLRNNKKFLRGLLIISYLPNIVRVIVYII